MGFLGKAAGTVLDKIVDSKIEEKRKQTLGGIIPKKAFSFLAERTEDVKKYRKKADEMRRGIL